MAGPDYSTIREKCPLSRTLKLICKKWSIDIIGLLICMGGSMRYTELQKQLVSISPKILSERLRDLTDAGIVKRTVSHDAIPIQVEYRLTDKGDDFTEFIDCAIRWGEKWESKPGHNGLCELCKNLKKR